MEIHWILTILGHFRVILEHFVTFSTSKISNQDSEAVSKSFSKIFDVLKSRRAGLSNGTKIIAIRSQKVCQNVPQSIFFLFRDACNKSDSEYIQLTISNLQIDRSQPLFGVTAATATWNTCR